MNTYRIEGRLRVKGLGDQTGGPFHLGASEGVSDYVDSLVHRDTRGIPLLPGTSLCGVLAGIAGDMLAGLGHSPETHPAFAALFGTARGAESASGQESRLMVWDAFMENADTSVRDRNAINRARGSADMHKLFHEEVIQGDWRFPVTLEFTASGPKSSEEAALEKDGTIVDIAAFRLLLDTLHLLSLGWGRIGGKTGIGYGHVVLEDCEIAQYDRCDPDHVCDYALNRWVNFARKPIADYLSETDPLPPGQSAAARERIRFTCILRPVEPLLVQTGYSAEVCHIPGCRHPGVRNTQEFPLDWGTTPMEFAVDGAFCLDATNKPYLPGSSLRGALRSRAERVIRTLVGPGEAWDPAQAEEMGKRFSELADFDEEDVACLVSRVFGFSGLGGRIIISDGVPIHPDTFESRRKLLDHVALDRFTGGAADKHKFNARPYFPPRLEDSQGNLCCQIELWDFQYWHLGMLLLLLRDLRIGRIAVGHGRNKGYGKVRLESATVEGLTGAGGNLAAVPDEDVDGTMTGELKTFASPMSFDEMNYLRTQTNVALSKAFLRAETAFREKIEQWKPKDEAGSGGQNHD